MRRSARLGLAGLAALGMLTSACADGVPTRTRSALALADVRLDIVSGDGQSAAPGSELPNPLVVRVTDPGGAPIGGQIVNFVVTAGGGEVYGGVSITTPQGMAQERWTLGPTAGAQEVQVRAVDTETGEGLVFAIFRATAGGSAPAPPPPAPVASVTVQPASASLDVAGTQQFSATLRDASGSVLTGRTVTWTSSDTAVASVSSSGLVTARRGGSATITATSEGRSGTASVTVTASVASVTVSPSFVEVRVTESRQLTAALRDANGNVLAGRPVTWSSSNEGVARVSSSGRVTGVAPGTATITATAEGVAGSATVRVTLLGLF